MDVTSVVPRISYNGLHSDLSHRRLSSFIYNKNRASLASVRGTDYSQTVGIVDLPLTVQRNLVLTDFAPDKVAKHLQTNSLLWNYFFWMKIVKASNFSNVCPWGSKIDQVSNMSPLVWVMLWLRIVSHSSTSVFLLKHNCIQDIFHANLFLEI